MILRLLIYIKKIIIKNKKIKEKPGMQSLITRAIERKIDTDRIAMLSSAHGNDVVSRRRLARLLSARAPCSAAWMTALPTEPALFMSTEDFRLALRHRLGLFPSDRMPRHCSCGEILGTNPYHFHSCPRHRRRSVTDRHDSIVKLFAGLCREAHALILDEDHWRPHDWPDMEIFFNAGPSGGHTISDASVVCSLAPSNLRHAATLLGSAQARSDAKRLRYRDLVQPISAANLPLVFESIGGMARHTNTLLRRLVASYASQPAPPRSPASWALLIRQRLSVCLQRGNAHVDRCGLRDAERASRSIRYQSDV